jgi:membrane-bound lytic murein transglycosylase A
MTINLAKMNYSKASKDTVRHFILPMVLTSLLGIVGCLAKPSLPNQPQIETSSDNKLTAAEGLPTLIPVEAGVFPTFCDHFNFDNLQYSIKNSLAYLKRRPPETLVYFGKDPYPISHLIRTLNHFLKKIRQKPSVSELNQFIAANYLVYRSIGKENDGQVLFTGYYEPFLNGSLVKTKTFRYPVYSLPSDLMTIDLSKFSKDLAGQRISGRYNGKTIVPYYNRCQIESDPNFAQKAKPIAWVDNQVDLFFLQVQGSGQIHLRNGRTINVHYHGTNGRPYRSIGKLLIEQGKISKEEMSMQKIRTYLNHHPEQIDKILQHNHSFIFFKKEIEGPLGYLGVPLTPVRSAAFDRKAFPPAALAFIQTKIPVIDGDKNITAWNEYRGFVLNQDTGGAIKGPGRTDIFWGSGPYAEVVAGHLKSQGELYFLILRPQSL